MINSFVMEINSSNGGWVHAHNSAQQPDTFPVQSVNRINFIKDDRDNRAI